LHPTAASAYVQRVAPPVAWTVLEALCPLGEKTPHMYVSLLAAASELATLGQKTTSTTPYNSSKTASLRRGASGLWWRLSAPTQHIPWDAATALALWAGKTVEGKVEIHDYAVQIKDARSPPLCWCTKATRRFTSTHGRVSTRCWTRCPAYT